MDGFVGDAGASAGGAIVASRQKKGVGAAAFSHPPR